jgi:hypothetical protein
LHLILLQALFWIRFDLAFLDPDPEPNLVIAFQKGFCGASVGTVQYVVFYIEYGTGTYLLYVRLSFKKNATFGDFDV